MILFEREPHELLGDIANMQANKAIFCLPYNPTAENMADYLLRTVCPEVLIGTGVVVTKVVLWETENCFATAELTEP